MSMSEQNYYDKKLESIIEKYDMASNDIIDSIYIKGCISKLFQEKCLNKKVALWGAGRNNTIKSHASEILKNYITYLQDMVCIIDSAKEVQGHTMFDFKVLSPEDAQKLDIELIIVASRASAESIKKSIREYFPSCEIFDIYQELRKQGINLYYNFYEEKSQYGYLYELRKKYEQEIVRENKQKLLKKIIATYLKIRDFVYAFKFIDEYIDSNYEQAEAMKNIKTDIVNILHEIKEKNKKKEDITVYFIDSVRAIDVIDNENNFKICKDYFDKTLFFANAYSTGPTTFESMIAIMTERYSYDCDVYADNFIYDVSDVPILNRALKNKMGIKFYTSEEYTIVKNSKDVEFDNHIHMTEKLWKLATDKASSDKPYLRFAYITWELHFPLLCGYLRNEPKINSFYEVGLKDMSDYIKEQFEDCLDYVDKEFTYYENIIHDKGYSVLFSDHSQVVYDEEHFWPFFKYYNNPEMQTHCIFAVQGPNIQSEIKSEYFSMINYNKILCNKIFHENNEISNTGIIKYEYYNIHNKELRKLAIEKGFEDYVNGMLCYASKDYLYMINIFGKEEVYRRGNTVEDIHDTDEGHRFIETVRKQYNIEFPEFLKVRV